MKKLYTYRFKYFLPIHIISLLITGITTTIIAYQKHVYGKEQEGVVYKYKVFENNSKILRNYYRYTGTETGFGFFAPSVKSHGAMFFESCDTLLNLPFETNEGNIRNHCLITSVTEYVQQELEQKEKEPTLKHRFSDLLIQNLVAKVRQINNLDNKCNTVKVEYKLVEFPPLKSTINAEAPTLFAIKTWIYETKN